MQTSTVCTLPLEIKWEIIKHLDIKSALCASNVLNISIIDVYRYFAFELKSDPTKLLPVMKEISCMIQENAHLFKALLLNKRFQRIDINFSFMLATGFELPDILEKLLKNPSVDPQW
jgi:hypothetical protein